MKHIIVLILIGLALTGCQTTGTTTSLKPVCAALVGPIRYNSKVLKSLYHAGRKLAPQLAIRNRVWLNLACKKYV